MRVNEGIRERDRTEVICFYPEISYGHNRDFPIIVPSPSLYWTNSKTTPVAAIIMMEPGEQFVKKARESILISVDKNKRAYYSTGVVAHEVPPPLTLVSKYSLPPLRKILKEVEKQNQELIRVTRYERPFQRVQNLKLGIFPFVPKKAPREEPLRTYLGVRAWNRFEDNNLNMHERYDLIYSKLTGDVPELEKTLRRTRRFYEDLGVRCYQRTELDAAFDNLDFCLAAALLIHDGVKELNEGDLQGEGAAFLVELADSIYARDNSMGSCTLCV